jgi:hypothetical protein
LLATSETRTAERQILIVGPYGVLGTGVVDAVAENPKWGITTAARRPTPTHRAQAAPPHISVDLLDSEGTTKAFSSLNKVTDLVIYEGARNDEAYSAWHLDAMKRLEPFTVGQYWGDSDQTRREVKTLTDDAWARLQQIRAKRDPNHLFADYLAGPGGFRNRNGWETNQ